MSSFDTNMKPEKFAFLKGFFCAVERKINVDMGQVSRYDKSNRENLRQNFELACWARCRNNISQKYVLFLACNRTVG